MKLVLGVDLGTSAVKISAVNHHGNIVAQASSKYSLSQPHLGYSEQNPKDWLNGIINAIKEILKRVKANDIAGISFSGQMHGLVLLDKHNQVLRPAILWNDTRTTKQCQEIMNKLGSEFVQITGNNALEGFTLPKILWVKENEPNIWQKAKTFLLPKDYVRLAMTNDLAMDYSDATGTVMLDIRTNQWSKKILNAFDIPANMCPKLVKSIEYVGNISVAFAQASGLSTDTKVFAGGGDNACGAVGSGILQPSQGLSSIGTSGVVLKFEEDNKTNYNGRLQMEDHAMPNSNYSMGVTLSAGYALSWFKKQFYPTESFDQLIADASKSSIGANGLIFTPYLMGERTPYADPKIRGSFIGVSGDQTRRDFARSVMEGITFSFKDIFEIYRHANKPIKKVVAIGGGARSTLWLQMQADIFDVPVVTLSNEQGPGLGAAMLAATGLGWYKDLHDCSLEFVKYDKIYKSNNDNVGKYQQVYRIYHQAYNATKDICHNLYDLKINLNN